MEILLGNPKPVESIRAEDAERLGVKGKDWNGFVRRPVKGDDVVTTIHPAEGNTLADTLRDVAHLWLFVSDADCPGWVSGDDAGTIAAVAAHFGCQVREG